MYVRLEANVRMYYVPMYKHDKTLLYDYCMKCIHSFIRHNNYNNNYVVRGYPVIIIIYCMRVTRLGK